MKLIFELAGVLFHVPKSKKSNLVLCFVITIKQYDVLVQSGLPVSLTPVSRRVRFRLLFDSLDGLFRLLHKPTDFLFCPVCP